MPVWTLLTKEILRLWSYFTHADPTLGQVKYLSKADAQKKGLVYVQSDGKAVLRVDSWTDLPLNAPRNSCVVPTKFSEVSMPLMPSTFSIIAFVSRPRKRSTMASLLLILPQCRAVALYGLLFGQMVLALGPITERSTSLRVSIPD